MGPSRDFLFDLALVLCVAAVTTVVFQRLRQPVVLGYLLAGLIVGPHVTPQLVSDLEAVQTLSEVGVILLMFSFGLELSVRRIARFGPTAALVCAIEVGGVFWIGYSVGELLSWSTIECVYAGACFALSSTAIVTKCFQEERVSAETRSLVFPLLVLEDLVSILMLAALTTLASGGGELSLAGVAIEALRLSAFLAGLLALGLLLVPRAMRALLALRRRETTLIAVVGLCFALALLARGAGYSVVLGAYLAGLLIAESGYARQIQPLVEPVRDVFAAVFFVSVGMLIDPLWIAEYWLPVVLLSLAVIVGKLVFVSIGGFLTGHGTRTSIRAAMSLGQVGELSFVIAGLGLALGATGARLSAVAVAVSAVTAFATPWMIRAAEPVSERIDAHLPKPLQTFASLYAAWSESVRASGPRGSRWGALRPMVRVILIDALVLVLVLATSSLAYESLGELLQEGLSMSVVPARILVGAIAVLACAPFALGIVRAVRRLGSTLAHTAMPEAVEGSLDLAAAPRRVLVASLQLALLLVVGFPIVAVTQPFFPGLPLGLLFGLAAVPAAVLFWRSAEDLQGHVRAGAQLVVEALVRESQSPASGALDEVQDLLPGLGDLTSVRLADGAPAVGRTLSEIDLRGASGATVIGITRGEERIALPDGEVVLRADDVLALSGTRGAIDDAREMLIGASRPG